MNELLTIKQVANMLHLAEGTLRYLRHQGKGPKSFKVGRKIAYRESDIIAYLDEQMAAEDARLAAIKEASN